jgi:hypothetical protein
MLSYNNMNLKKGKTLFNVFMLENKDLNVLPYKDIFQLIYEYKSIQCKHLLLLHILFPLNETNHYLITTQRLSGQSTSYVKS